MRPFTSNQSPRETLQNALGLFARLFIRTPALEHMSHALEALSIDELSLACKQYHLAVEAMASSPARRVSGSLWKDELLYCVIQRENPFSLAAARGERSEACILAMKEQLEVLGMLSTFEAENFVSIVQHRQRCGKGFDEISKKSAVIWAGGTLQDKKPARDEEPLNIPFAFSPWKYGEMGLSDIWTADEALEEIYLRFMESEDWAGLTEDIWNLFASYGSGIFLRHRAFRLRGRELVPLPEKVIAPMLSASAYERQHSYIMENTIAFMRGEEHESLLLTGPSGVGKTAHAAALLHELPEVRLILVSDDEINNLSAIMERLSEQPLKFLLLLDDIRDEAALRTFGSSMLGMRALPDNVLVYGTARQYVDGIFTRELPFPYLTLDSFAALIGELTEQRGTCMDRQQIRNAAVDHQVDVREKLTFSGAVSVAGRLMAGEL